MGGRVCDRVALEQKLNTDSPGEDAEFTFRVFIVVRSVIIVCSFVGGKF